MTPDELWEKWIAIDENKVNAYDTFCSLLAEYGAAVRKRDAEICRGQMLRADVRHNHGVFACAAAISREPLP
jgi:hypothetical protein